MSYHISCILFCLFKCIGATTFDEYKKYIEKDSALKRRFQPIQVPEPSTDEAIAILRGIRRKYEIHHGVTYTEMALIKAVELSKQYIGLVIINFKYTIYIYIYIINFIRKQDKINCISSLISGNFSFLIRQST